ncbi:MAG: hypothetical protein SGJ02_02570 [bacterium]|nr:hypothetical protein [bacterium]
MELLKSATTSILIFVFLYLNIDALNSTLGLRFKPLITGYDSLLPNHWITQRLFRVFDVFDRWTNFNFGYRAYGSRTYYDQPPISPTTEMIDLDIYKYFPQIRGEANRRIWLQSFRQDSQRLKIAYSRMTSTLQRLHNLKHPHDSIVQVFIYRYEWQKSLDGFDANMDKGKIMLEGHN